MEGREIMNQYNWLAEATAKKMLLAKSIGFKKDSHPYCGHYPGSQSGHHDEPYCSRKSLEVAVSKHRGSDKFREIRLDDLDLRGVDLSGVDFWGAVFSECDLTGVNFMGASLDHAEFQECNVLGVDFSGASLYETFFLNCFIYKSIFYNANIVCVEIENLQKRWNRWYEVDK
jgi:uncharacterized protein YjbI with pentapeptide repeats